MWMFCVFMCVQLIYLDGEVAAKEPCSHSSDSTVSTDLKSLRFAIGSSFNIFAPSNGFDGLIDELR